MFTQLWLLLFFTVILTVQGFDITNVLANNPDFGKCIVTFDMFDASGKIPTGISGGNLIDLGDFDLCLSINRENNSVITKGKYCMMKIRLPPEFLNSSSLNAFGFDLLPEPEEKHSKIDKRMIMQSMNPTDNTPGLILGLCIPYNCPVSDFSILMSSVLEEINPKMNATPFNDGICQMKEDLKIEYSTNSIIFITFLSITLFLMIISTIYDMYIRHHKRKPAHIILLAFSALTNGQKLLSVSNNPDQLPCLNGIRFISMMWVLFGHRYISTLMGPVRNLNYVITDWMKDAGNMYILNAPVSVDSFFVLSGLLLGYGYCLSKEKGVKFNIILFYVHRYLRLTPVLAVVVWAHTSIIGYLGSGPFWSFSVSVLQNFCIDYWWSPLVYAQNYYNTQKMCIGQTWYLAVDMQLYILSPIILIPLWKWPKKTLFVSIILVFGSMATSFATTYVNDLPSSSSDFGGSENYMKYYYYTTHTRYGPWLMGLMLGYYLFKLKKNRNTRISLHPAQVAFGWIVGMALLLSTLYAGHGLLVDGYKLGNSFFNAFHRHGWSLGLCWVIFACTQGYGGPVNTFLSWSVFQVLGRFTYTMYLVHLSFMYLLLGASKTSNQFSDFDVMYAFWGDFIYSLAMAVCLTLAYESPMITIEKVLFKTGRNPQKQELPVHNPSTSQGQTNKGFAAD